VSHYRWTPTLKCPTKQ